MAWHLNGIRQLSQLGNQILLFVTECSCLILADGSGLRPSKLPKENHAFNTQELRHRGTLLKQFPLLHPLFEL